MAPNKRKAVPLPKAPIATLPKSTANKTGKKARFEGPPPTIKAAPKKRSEGNKPYKKSDPKPVKIIPTPPAPSTFIVSVGSYERLLYGLSCTLEATEEDTTALLPYKVGITPVFSFPAHLSSLRTVAASLLQSPGTGSERKVGGKYLVSGGTDEVVKVWDLKRKKEVGSLDGEAIGTITCLKFVPQRGILLAASTDSAITIYRVREWVLLRQLKGHKGRVNSIDAHPAGRVALSVGEDKMLRMWDLVAGKAVATLKIGAEGDIVKWNSDGTKFAIICASTLTVYDNNMAVHHTLTTTTPRFHDVRFCYFPIDASDSTQREFLFVACEDGKTKIFDITDSTGAPVGEDSEAPTLEAVAQLAGHENRVKMIDLLEVALPTSTPSAPTSTIIVTTISSDGKINLYDMAILPKLRLLNPTTPGSGAAPFDVEPSASFDTDGSRLTCVNVIGMAEVKKVDSEDVAVEEDDDEEEDESDEEGHFEEVEGDDDDDDDKEDEDEGEPEFDDEEELDFEEE